MRAAVLLVEPPGDARAERGRGLHPLHGVSRGPPQGELHVPLFLHAALTSSARGEVGFEVDPLLRLEFAVEVRIQKPFEFLAGHGRAVGTCFYPVFFL
ncbi:hypothetical protein MFU01_49230 [Myxococcus fulvus]|uniref:Uncharacterized protein n=1 Tax=Myxococcus fulvus TaxID=33 RepID=A0A511T6T8_MYXFU|nr:hypothetical protein MFU01_49230 [Myxococcus fulvus]